MGFRLGNAAPCRKFQGVSGKAAVVQCQIPAAEEGYGASINGADKRLFSIFSARSQVAFCRNGNGSFLVRGNRSHQEQAVIAAALAGQVDIPGDAPGVDDGPVVQDADGLAFGPDSVLRTEVQDGPGIQVGLFSRRRAHDDALSGAEAGFFSGVESFHLQIAGSHTVDIQAAVGPGIEHAAEVHGNGFVRRPDVRRAPFQDQVVPGQVAAAVGEGVADTGLAQDADVPVGRLDGTQFQFLVPAGPAGTAGHVDIAVGYNVQFPVGFNSYRDFPVNPEYLFTLVIGGIAHVRTVGIDHFLQIVQPVILGNAFHQDIFSIFVAADIGRLEGDVVPGNIGLFRFRISAAGGLVNDGITDGIEQVIFFPAGTGLLQVCQMAPGRCIIGQIVVGTAVVSIPGFQGFVLGIPAFRQVVGSIVGLQFRIPGKLAGDAGLVFGHVSRLFVRVAAFSVNEAQVFPSLDQVRRVAPVDGVTGRQGICQRACGFQIDMATRRNGPYPHIAVLGQVNVLFCPGVKAAGKRIQRIHGRIRCVDPDGLFCRPDASLEAGQVNPVSFHRHAAAFLGQIAQGRQGHIPILIAGLYQVHIAGFAIGTVYGDAHITAARIQGIETNRVAEGFDGNVFHPFGRLESHIVPLDQAGVLGDGPVLRRNGNGGASAALAGLDIPVQVHAGVAGHLDGRIPVGIAEEADAHGMIRLDTAHILLSRAGGSGPFGFFPFEPAQKTGAPGPGLDSGPGVVQDHIVIDKDVLTVSQIFHADVGTVVIVVGLFTFFYRLDFLLIFGQGRLVQGGHCTPEAGFMGVGIFLGGGHLLAAGPVVAEIFQRIIGALGPSGADDFPVSRRLVPLGQVFDNSAVPAVFRHRVLRRIADADQAFSLVADQFAHLQVRICIVVDGNVIGSVQGSNLAVPGAGNTAAQVNLSAVGIDIGNDQFIRGGIVEHIRLIGIGPIGLEHRSALDHPVDRTGHDQGIGQFRLAAGIPVLLQGGHRRLHGTVLNGYAIGAIAALDEAVDVDVRCIDVDIVPGNAGAAAILDLTIGGILAVDRGGVNESIGIVVILLILLVQPIVLHFRIAADIDDAVGKALADGFARRQVDFLAADFRRAAVRSLQQDAVIVGRDVDHAVFRFDRAVDLNIRLLGFGGRLSFNGRIEGSRTVITGDVDDPALAGIGICRDGQADSRSLVAVHVPDSGRIAGLHGMAVVGDFTARIDGLDVSHLHVQVGVVFDGHFRCPLGCQGTGPFQGPRLDGDVAAGSQDVRKDDGIHGQAADRDVHRIPLGIDCLRQEAQILHFIENPGPFCHIALESGSSVSTVIILGN